MKGRGRLKRWLRLHAALISLFLSASTGGAQAELKKASSFSKPQRIVSLNLCTDQLLIMLVEPSRIAAVTAFSHRKSMSVMLEKARKLPVTNGQAEQVFMLNPDLVLSGTFSTSATVNLLRRLKRKVVLVRPARHFSDIFDNISIIGRAVGEPERAQQMIAAFKADLAAVQSDKTRPLPLAALYFAQGYSSGKNTLINRVVRKGGFMTLGEKLKFEGTRKLSLESLILHKPEALIVGSPKYRGAAMAYEIFQHPAMIHLKKQIAHTSLGDALTVCGTPHIIKAVEKIRRFQRRVIADRGSRE